MRISIDQTLNNGGVVALPTDPDPLDNLNDLYQVELFQASDLTPKPFTEVDVGWRIVPAADNNAPDAFEFIVQEFEGRFFRETFFTGIELSGTGAIAALRSMTLRLMGRRAGTTGPWGPIGPAVDIALDLSDCRVAPVSRLLFDPILIGDVSGEITSNSQIRFRQAERPIDPSQPVLGTEMEVLEPSPPEWPGDLIRYGFPLEIVINNFFNADFNLTLELRMSADVEADESFIDVDANFDFVVDFSTGEDVTSLGSAALIATTIRRMMPMILDCKAREVERKVATRLLGAVGVTSDGPERLVALDITGGAFGEILMTLCRPPVPRGPVLADRNR